MPGQSTIPTADGAVPVLGHLMPLLRDPWTFLRALPEQGDLVRVRLGPVHAVLVCDPGLATRMLDDPAFRGSAPDPGVLRFPEAARRRSARIEEVLDSWSAGQIIDVFPEMRRMATSETIAAAVTSALYLLTRDHEARARIRAELNAVLAGRVARDTDLPYLEHTGRTAGKTLRLWSPGWFVSRIAETGTRLGGYPVPAHTRLLYSPALLQHRMNLDPDSTPRHRDTPETTLVLASVLARWSPKPMSAIPPRPRLTRAPRPDGLRMRLRPAPVTVPHR
ncbi:cytochrome P450 [Sciscionella sediminilitoris]|uniref:cytochrome P450 n=1 Tax=Sciscionella sediminilitoris TaxID=1445613 RepID=UPI0004DECDD1|nr:cytochrome P450 [Sciscionella sp. SE31]